MNGRIVSLLLLCAALSSAAPHRKKNQGPPEATPLDKYIAAAYRDYKLPETAPPPGSTWSPNALFANLGMDLKAARVDDLVTVVVSETFSAVATGDVKTQRQSTAQEQHHRTGRRNQGRRTTGQSRQPKHPNPITGNGRDQPRRRPNRQSERSRNQCAAQRLSGDRRNQARASELGESSGDGPRRNSPGGSVSDQQHPFQPDSADGNPSEWQGRNQRFHSSPKHFVSNLARNSAVLTVRNNAILTYYSRRGADVAGSCRCRFPDRAAEGTGLAGGCARQSVDRLRHGGGSERHRRPATYHLHRAEPGQYAAADGRHRQSDSDPGEEHGVRDGDGHPPALRAIRHARSMPRWRPWATPPVCRAACF